MICKRLFSTHCVSGSVLSKNYNNRVLQVFTEGLSKLPQVTELIKEATRILNNVCLPQAQPNAKHTVAPLEYLINK